MPVARKCLHVYADTQRFYLVPMVRTEAGLWLEVQPVTEISLFESQTNPAAFSKALESAVSHSRHLAGAVSGMQRWDGDKGRLWLENILFVVVRWYPTSVRIAPQVLVPGDDEDPPGWVDQSSEDLPSEVPFSTLAQRIFAYMEQG